MLLKEFPDLNWLRQQARTRFENRRAWNGQPLPQAGWPNVILQVKAREIYRDNIAGPFSLFGNLSGASWVKTGNRKIKIDADHFFITNAGQEYTLEIDKQDPSEAFNIHFGESFADQAIQSLQKPEHLLDNDYVNSLQQFAFHNRLIRKTKPMLLHIEGLQRANSPLDEEEKLVDLFRLIYQDEQSLTGARETIPSVRQSTKKEIFRRILLSVDYIYSHYNRPMNLDTLAQTSCLSKFHFLRLFRVAMGETPHQFITRVRLRKARELLKNRQMDVASIAQEVGFTNASSFSRLFFNQTGAYPSQFRP